MGVIEVRGLRKEYRRRGGHTVAVAGLDLDVPEGGVFGFLGPNGSGKTTTIRCLLGLARPTAGQLHLLGADVATQLPTVVDQVGALVESPKFFPNFSGHRNLSLLAQVGHIDASRVDLVLDTVGLSDRAKDRYGSYSLGMKQRLGVAATLLKNPRLLVLDEPANGLDPAGIKDMRELIARLGAEGRTVFISSHQLTEVQQMCDAVAILSRGRCITAGPVRDVLARGGHRRLLVTVADPDRAAAVLRQAGFETAATDQPDELAVSAGADRGADITRALAEQGIYLRGLAPDAASLEDVFLQLTGENMEARA